MTRKVSAKVKWAVGILLGLVLALVGVTTAYAAHYSDRALPGVSVAGTSVTGQTQEEVAQAVAKSAGDISVTVNIDGTPTSAKLSDLGITVDADATAAKAFADNPSWTSRVGALFAHTDVSVVSTTDDATLAAFGQKLSASLGSPATDATVKVSDDGASFVATDAASGKGVDTKALATAAAKAVSTLTSQSVDLSAVDVTPTVTTEAAQKTADAANALVALDVTISDGVDNYTASAADKVQWVKLPDTPGTGSPAFDDAKVSAWVTSTAESTNEDAVAGIKNVNSSGKVVSVASEGSAGWKVNNADAVAKAVVESLTQGQSYSGSFDYDKVEPTYTTREIADGAEKLVYQAAAGEKWIDVNLSNYTVTAYEGATVVNGPFYMVPGAPETPTVTGTYHVYLKYEKQTMRGKNADGTSYETPDVPWVTYFTGSYALHGAPWRSSFGWGGEGGSHGCVNMPVSAAKWIYDWSEIGTTVVSHK